MKAEKAANIALENDELTDLLERNKYEKKYSRAPMGFAKYQMHSLIQ
jgi:hypothetical protein